MAKIEMDISEFDSMRENKNLLQESLKREKELSEQIKKLNDEKIKALEESKMRVVKVVKNQTNEFLMMKRDNKTIFRELSSLFNSNRAMYDPNNNYGGSSNEFIDSIINNICNIFFEKVTSKSSPVESITTHGLDEIKSELREELDNKYREKIDSYDKVVGEKDKLRIEITNLKNQIETILYKNNNLINENKKLVSDLSSIRGYMDKISDKIYNYNFFSILFGKKSIKKIIEDYIKFKIKLSQ